MSSAKKYKVKCSNISLHPHLCACGSKKKKKKRLPSFRLRDTARLELPALTTATHDVTSRHAKSKQLERAKHLYLYVDAMTKKHEKSSIRKTRLKVSVQGEEFDVPKFEISRHAKQIFPGLPAQAVYPLLFSAEEKYKEKLQKRNHQSHMLKKTNKSSPLVPSVGFQELNFKKNAASPGSGCLYKQTAADNTDDVTESKQCRRKQGMLLRQFSSQVPVHFLHYAKEYSATIIQANYRGYLGRIVALKRLVLLNRLHEVCRPFYWRQEMKRVCRCFFSWRTAAQFQRLHYAATRVQTSARMFLARRLVKRMKKGLNIFRRLACSWRGGWAFYGWQMVVWRENRERLMQQAFRGWRMISRATHAFRVALIWAGGLWRENILKGALVKWWYWCGSDRHKEECARMGISFLRMKRNVKAQRKLRFLRKKWTIVYWRMQKNISLYRRRCPIGAVSLQRLFRAHIDRVHANMRKTAAGIINRYVRGLLGRNRWNMEWVHHLAHQFIRRWRELTPLWRLERIKLEKQLLYRQVVKQRHYDRAHSKQNELPSFDVLLNGMIFHLELSERAKEAGLDIKKMNEEEEDKIFHSPGGAGVNLLKMERKKNFKNKTNFTSAHFQ